MSTSEPRTEALRKLYWRSEILQLMYWLRGEGFGDLLDPPLLERFLGVDAAINMSYLDRLVDEGYVTRDGEWYALSELGLKEGALEFASAFDDLTRPTHGECSEDCWCHASAEEAAACSQTKPHDHDHGEGGHR
ncbi:MAG: hypothetical protein WD232_07525 [Acidimicrobiales bacterium]